MLIDCEKNQIVPEHYSWRWECWSNRLPSCRRGLWTSHPAAGWSSHHASSRSPGVQQKWYFIQRERSLVYTVHPSSRQDKTRRIWDLGTTGNSKTDVFSEKFQKGGGVISNPKIYIADFGLLNRAFWAWKCYKRVISGYVFQPITMLNCCTTCISWEIGSYNTFML